MKELNSNMYYALVWNTSLSNKKQVIKGTKITRSTRLPKDPRMLYGTNNNDIARIIKKDNWMEVKYDIMTQRETVTFWKEEEEYVIYRDIRIIVWQGNDELYLPKEMDKYKIVSPELFEYICSTSEETLEDIHLQEDNFKEILNVIELKGTSCPCDNTIITITSDTITYKKRVEEDEDRIFE